MASIAVALFSRLTLRRSFFLFHHRHPLHFLTAATNLPRHFSSSGSTTTSFTNTTASFDWSSEDEDDTKPKNPPPPTTPATIPPPYYDPFDKSKNRREERDRCDPKNLQEVFHRMRAGEGLTEYAVKMFDGLSKDGRTHEALELFSQIKDKGSMPDVVAHTAVLEAYADAGGHCKDLLRTFQRMLASGVLPNAYTYAVLVKGLARAGNPAEAGRYMLEMMGKGMRPNAATYTAVFEEYVKKEGKGEGEGRKLLEQMRTKGFEIAHEEKAVRETMRSKRGEVYRGVMSLLFGK